MQSKFDKYWSDMSDMHCIASIIDPHYKISLLTYIYKQKMDLSNTEAEEILDSIKTKYVRLYKINFLVYLKIFK